LFGEIRAAKLQSAFLSSAKPNGTGEAVVDILLFTKFSQFALPKSRKYLTINLICSIIIKEKIQNLKV